MKISNYLSLFVLTGALLTGCSKHITETQTPELTRANAVDYDDSLITVGFVQTGKESDWRDANTKDFLDTFTKTQGYNLIYIDGNSHPERQIKAVYDLIAQKVDYIILDPIVEDGWEEVLTEAKKQEIPVIISDRQISADPSLYTCWIGSDFYQEGVKAATWLDRYLAEIGRGRDNINIVILEGTQGASAAIGRTKGLMDEIVKHPNWNVVASECGNFTQGEGTTIMTEILKEHQDIDVVIAENDNMMFGAMMAMDRAGISYGVNTDVITISFDGLHEAFENMIEGKLMVSVECNPLIAEVSRRVIYCLENDIDFERTQYVEESVFTYKNAAMHIKNRKY